MADLKTKPNDKNVHDFLNEVFHKGKKEDSFKILDIMQEITGEKPVMWGESIVGFGNYTYKNCGGSVQNWFYCGFSPRKQNISIYIMSGFSEFEEILKGIGKHKLGKSCFYINKLADIDVTKLKKLIKDSVANLKKNEFSV